MYVESTNETVRMIRFSVLNRCSSVALPDLWLANCYFAHDSSGFPHLLPFCDAPFDTSFYPLYPSHRTTRQAGHKGFQRLGQPNRRRISFLRGHARHARGKMTPNHMNAAIPERKPATQQISGVIERVTFHNEESGFCVLRVKARGQRDETTVRVAAFGHGWGMAQRGGLVGQGQGTWAAIQSHHSEDRAADHSRGDRAVPRQRPRERNRTDPREEAGGALRSRGSRRH